MIGKSDGYDAPSVRSTAAPQANTGRLLTTKAGQELPPTSFGNCLRFQPSFIGTDSPLNVGGLAVGENLHILAGRKVHLASRKGQYVA